MPRFTASESCRIWSDQALGYLRNPASGREPPDADQLWRIYHVPIDL